MIWYEYDKTHSRLDELLERLRSMTETPTIMPSDRFLTVAQELEELGKNLAPTPDQIDRVRILFRFEHNRRHFYQHALPNWLPILWNEGELSRFSEPQMSDDGSANAYNWDAGSFFVKAASDYPDIAEQIIISIKTDNWLVLLDLARSLRRLPPDTIPRLIRSIRSWFESPYIRFSPLGSTMLDLLQDLVRNAEWKAALILLDSLVQWNEGDDRGPVPLLRDYEFELLVKGPSRELAKARSLDVLNILKRELRKVLSSKEGLFTRSAIEDTDQDQFETDFDWLVVGVRDTLLVLADHDTELITEQLVQTLNDPLPLFQRIGLFILTENPRLIRTIDADLNLPF